VVTHGTGVREATGRGGQRQRAWAAAAHVGGVHVMPVCGKRRVAVANGSGGLEGGDSAG
jgi:hypothetical protein